ncbi:acyltransferase family protein [Duganella sp. FT135W]|uniref:Acyltransferase family protein n=1 Tax=Duganella flavida TaxID=2692175 RepID=A0A6L8KD82_9BURK|nr:acyltransferase [Duganella flavida]MYM23792.1 acyltransferase family protein [Duganella flavida]
MISPDTARLRGLDLLRAAAILLVLMSHYQGFVSHAETFGVIGASGWAGVDLFFVLSGYLIGNQILAPIARGQEFSLKVFFARRLLRTLPNYYVVLAVYLLVAQLFPHSAILGKSTSSIWQFLTFTQNFGLAYGQTFSHSWSLCIEEQFYVVMPLVVLALARWTRSARPAWCLLGAAILAGIAARSYAWLVFGHNAHAAEVYYSSFCRSDELLFGVAIAMLRNFHADQFARLTRHGNVLLVVGLSMAVAVLACFANEMPTPFLVSALGYSLVAASFAVLTCAALSPNCLLNRIWVPGASSLALWSYAIYLAHKPIFMLLNPWCERLGVDPESPLCILVIVAIASLGGWVLFRLVETPFMNLRARWYPAAVRSQDAVRSSSAVKQEALRA